MFRKSFLDPKKLSIFFIFSLLISFWPLISQAQTLGDQSTFFVNPEMDYHSRSHLQANLVYQTNKLKFYIDSTWWSNLTPELITKASAQLFYLASYFENNDYKKLVSIFGSESIPGLDGDDHIYVLIHPMKENYLGYARFEDTLPANMPNVSSNQHEIVYLNPQVIMDVPPQQLGYYLSHEVLHLISFNQKGLAINSEDERWLSEARSDYLSTLLGYDNNYEGSFLQKRVESLKQNTNFSLLNFRGTASDYAAVHLLAEYIVEHYGMKILVDSMHSQLTGVASLNEALAKNGFSDDFNTIFSNWLITMALNDCQMGEKYCFTNSPLANFKIYPYTNYLSDFGSNSLSASTYVNVYSGNWLKITGGKGDLKLKYEFSNDAQFFLPMVMVDQNNNKTVKIYSNKDGAKGVITIPDFGKTSIAVYLMPFVTKSSNGAALFSWGADIGTAANNSSSEEVTQNLVDQLNYLKFQVALLTTQLNLLIQQKNLSLNSSVNSHSEVCAPFQNDLQYGMLNNAEVKCLQKLLWEKEPALYPLGLITGNFLDLTKKAVEMYQQKYGLPQTGYFGPLTRTLANSQWFLK